MRTLDITQVVPAATTDRIMRCSGFNSRTSLQSWREMAQRRLTSLFLIRSARCQMYLYTQSVRRTPVVPAITNAQGSWVARTNSTTITLYKNAIRCVERTTLVLSITTIYLFWLQMPAAQPDCSGGQLAATVLRGGLTSTDFAIFNRGSTRI
jgi:hypothetical protein